MPGKVKLRQSIIIGGIAYMHDKVINRRLLEGTRFDDPEFIIEPSDPDFNRPLFDSVDEIKTEPIIEEDGKPVEAEIVRPRKPLQKFGTRRG